MIKFCKQASLRAKAETQLAYTPLKKIFTRSADELQHELFVHQIELEMQNDELRRSQIALEESRDRYVDLYEFAPVGYLTLNHEGLVDEINLTGATLFGLERSELINRRFAALVTPQDSDHWHRLFKGALKNEGQGHDLELLLQRSNNAVFHARLNFLLVVTDNKAPRVRITLTDISQLKKTEEALLISQKDEEASNKCQRDLNYAQAVAHIGSWRMDTSNNILNWSDENFRIFGITKGMPLTYQSFLNCVHPADRQLVDGAWKDALTGKPYDLEHRIIVNHDVKWVHEKAELEFDKHGILLGAFGTTDDITSRKLLEDRLRWTEENFRLMVASVTDYSIVMLDPEGRVMSWNSGAERISGYCEEEIIGRHFSGFYQSEDIDCGTPQRLLDVVKAIGWVEDEDWIVRKDGSTFWGNVVYAAVRDPVGTLRGYSKVTQDLTERKRLDQMLQDKNVELEIARSVAEIANLAKSDFLSSMSHELRTPLNTILGFAQLLEAGSPPPTEVQSGRLSQIIKAGWYLLELINEILNLSVIESGKLSLSLESVLLIDVILECKAMIEPEAQERGIKLIFPPYHNILLAYVDRTRLKQVLLNLLSNALKYNRPHGTVEVKCTATPHGHIRISIKDSGPGLLPEQMAQLFQPFNRLGQESGIEEGTGLGLAITKKLVELMNGSIGVESTVGEGSEFWIELAERQIKP